MKNIDKTKRGTSMTPEELMKPRYKVIADYPDNKNKIGDIIPMKHAGTAAACDLVCGWYDRFPSIYKRLEWWEDRKPEDMPEYVKHVERDQVWHVRHWDVNIFYVGEDQYIGAAKVIPITLEDYNEYINKNQTK